MRVLALVAALVLAVPASAEGLSWSVGVGAGGSNLGPSLLGRGAGALSGRLAYGLTEDFDVGGEIFLMGQYHGDPNMSVAALSSIMAQVTYHQDQPWYGTLGLGWGSALGVLTQELVAPVGAVTNVWAISGNGLSLAAAAGWTFVPGPRLSVELRYDLATLWGELEGTAHTLVLMGRIGN